jgi:hypothetical protein
MSIRVVCPDCLAVHHVGDDEAGGTVRCRRCGVRLVVPDRVDSYLQYRPGAVDVAFRQRRYTIPRGQFFDRYEVCDPEGKPVLFLDRPKHFRRGWTLGCLGLLLFCTLASVAVGVGLAVGGQTYWLVFVLWVAGALVAWRVSSAVVGWLSPTRKVRFYADPEKRFVLLEVLAREGRFTCNDGRGNLVGRFRREAFTLVRKNWVCHGPDGDVLLRAVEDSVKLALARRLLGPALDVFGNIWVKVLQWTVGGNLGLLPRNFTLLGGRSGAAVGHLHRGYTALNPYGLELSEDQDIEVDGRLAVALAVVLDVDERTS